MTKRRLIFAFGALLVVALFVAMRQTASWRPKIIGRAGAILSLPSLRFSPDGRFVALRNSYSGDDDTGYDRYSVWSLALPGDARQLSPGTVAISPDGQTLALVRTGFNRASSDDFSGYVAARLQTLPDGKLIHELRAEEKIYFSAKRDVAFTPDGRTLLVASPTEIHRFDVQTGTVGRVRFSNGGPWSISSQFCVFSPDTTRVIRYFTNEYWMRRDKSGQLSTGQDVSKYRLWICDARSGKPLRALVNSRGWDDNRPGWSPDGQLCWQIKGGRARLWNAQSGAIVRQWNTNGATEIHFTPDSKYLAVATSNGLELRDVTTGQIAHMLPGPRAEPFAIAPDGNFAVSADKTGALWKWRLK